MDRREKRSRTLIQHQDIICGVVFGRSSLRRIDYTPQSSLLDALHLIPCWCPEGKILISREINRNPGGKEKVKMRIFNVVCLRVKSFYGGMMIMKLSKSRLTTFITCPQKYLISYILRVRPLKTSPEFIIGSSTHHLISTHYLKKMSREPCDLQLVLDEFWAKYDLENADFADLEEMEAAKLKSLEFAKLFLKETDIEPLHTEYPFSLPINKGVTH
jgi:hypothetical protein